MTANMIKVTLVSGMVGKKKTQRRVVQALGLKKYGSSVVHADNPTIRGMVTKVNHLVTVAAAEGTTGKGKDSESKALAKAKAEVGKKSTAKVKESK